MTAFGDVTRFVIGVVAQLAGRLESAGYRWTAVWVRLLLVAGVIVSMLAADAVAGLAVGFAAFVVAALTVTPMAAPIGVGVGAGTAIGLAIRTVRALALAFRLSAGCLSAAASPRDRL